MSIISRSVACSSGSTTEKLAPPEVVSGIAMRGYPSSSMRSEPRPRRHIADGALHHAAVRSPACAERENAGHGGAAADRGIERHRAAVQLDEGAHQRQPQAGAAMTASRANGSRTSRTPCPSSPAECRGPWSVTENTTASWQPLGAASVTVSPAGEKPMALASRLNRAWRTRRSSATKLPMSGGGADIERDVILAPAGPARLRRRLPWSCGCRPRRDRASSRRRRWWRGRGCC